MYKIKVDFVDKISDTACEAFGLFIIVELGLTSHRPMVMKNPDARMMIGVGFPGEKKD